MPSQWEYKDFVWTHPKLSAGNCTADMLLMARTEWWSEAKELIMPEIQKWLDEGWEPTITIGPDCWDTKKITIRQGWRSGEGYCPVAFRVQMKRKTP